MRHEAAQVADDLATILTDAQSSGLMMDDPQAEHGMVAVEIRQGRQSLINESFRAVLPSVGLCTLALPHNGYVRALASELWLLNIIPSQRLSGLEARQQIRMIGK